MPITTTKDGGIIVEGPKAMQVFRLVALQSALKLEIKCPGLKMSRGMSALKAAKLTTGLKSNNREVQLAEVERLLAEARSKVTYVVEVPEGEVVS